MSDGINFESLWNTADVPLGSLVLDIEQAHEDSWKPTDLTKDKDYSVKQNANIVLRVDAFSESWFRVQVLSWLKAVLSRAKSSHLRVTADSGFVYHLADPKRVLRDICRDTKAKEWLEDAAGIRSIYMVTELWTLVDPKLEHAGGKGSVYAGQVPVTDGTTKYADAEGGHRSGSSEEKNLTALGERIYKIKFRKVKLRFAVVPAAAEKEQAGQADGEADSEETAAVKPTMKMGARWKSLLVSRGEGDDPDGEGEVMVEADVEDDDEGEEVGCGGEDAEESEGEYEEVEEEVEEEEEDEEGEEDNIKPRGKTEN
ncbi:hypothetical protein B0J18DRAFT_431693 [Chaetomium sp. MPI-SDFR-AT-0129]|nr:hypothetical protein B0J18DRAFT_431693 [Chaetomium sp. MPI-SDFR-AT-0129]